MKDDTRTPSPRPRVAISACTLGHPTRFDGGHKRHRVVSDDLLGHLDFVPLCPEVEMGLSTPRPTIQLRRNHAGDIRLVESRSGQDHTEKMQAYTEEKLRYLAKQDLCGFIAQSKSPSCGTERVRLYPPIEEAAPAPTGVGMFTAELKAAMPLLPVIESGRLFDPLLRAHFLERVFAYARLKELFGHRWSYGELVAFHSREKLLLLSHSSYREVGRIVATGRHEDPQQLAQRYTEAFMAALETPASVGKQVNVLQHMVGYFRRGLAGPEREEIHASIADYQRTLVPLLVPITLIRHVARRLELDYLLSQSYLAPHPRELRLRTHMG